jgi:hypothetical protein
MKPQAVRARTHPRATGGDGDATAATRIATSGALEHPLDASRQVVAFLARARAGGSDRLTRRIALGVLDTELAFAHGARQLAQRIAALFAMKKAARDRQVRALEPARERELVVPREEAEGRHGPEVELEGVVRRLDFGARGEIELLRE